MGVQQTISSAAHRENTTTTEGQNTDKQPPTVDVKTVLKLQSFSPGMQNSANSLNN